MKRLLFILITAFCVGSQLRALPYDQARQEAWFLTDKMAYELNLTSDQYDRAYQVNLDYFLSIGSEADCYGYYWTYRDNDLRYILFDWQYSLYSTLDYFFRPVRWLRSAWYFPIFDHYRRGYYYFDRPLAYLSYRGVGWRRRGHNDRSPFAGYSPRPGGGLRDRYHGGGAPPTRPEIGRGGHNDRPGFGNNNGRPGFGNNGNNGRPGFGNGNNSRPGFGNGNNGNNGRPGNGNTGGRDNNTGGFGQGNSNNRPGNGNTGGFGQGNNSSTGRGSSTTTRPSRGNNGAGAGTYTNPGRGGNSAGAGRGTSTSRPSRSSFGSGSSTTTRSQSAPSRSSSSSSRPSRSFRR